MGKKGGCGIPISDEISVVLLGHITAHSSCWAASYFFLDVGLQVGGVSSYSPPGTPLSLIRDFTILSFCTLQHFFLKGRKPCQSCCQTPMPAIFMHSPEGFVLQTREATMWCQLCHHRELRTRASA